MKNSGMDLLTDFDDGIEEKRRQIEERKSRFKQRRQRAIDLVKESYNHYGNDPGSVVSHKEQLRSPGVGPFVYNHGQPSSRSEALPIKTEASVDRFALSVGDKKTTDSERNMAYKDILATESTFYDCQQGSEPIGVLHQDTTFATKSCDKKTNHCDNENCECRQITASPCTTYLLMLRNFVQNYDELSAIKPIPVRERTLYEEPAFLTIDHTPRDTGSRIRYLSPLDSHVVVQPELPRNHGQHSGLEMTSFSHPDLPGTTMDDSTSLDGYGRRMSSKSISIDLPFASPTELNVWKAPRASTPYNTYKSTPTPSASSGVSEDTEQPSTASPQLKNRIRKLYRRVKRSVHNIRHSLHNLLCGTTVQSLQ